MTATETWEPNLTHAALGLERLLRATAWSAIVLGVLWALPAFGVVPDTASEILDRWWPMVPLVAGTSLTVRGHRAAGAVLVLAAVLLLLPRVTPDGYRGPALLIALGLIVLVASVAQHRLQPGLQAGMFDDVEVALTDQVGGTTCALFGEVHARLHPAPPPPGNTGLVHAPPPRGLLAVFGSARLEIPADLPVRLRGVAVFGDVKGPDACGSDAPALEVTAVAVFGDVTIERRS